MNQLSLYAKRTGDTLFAFGERGTVLLSSDTGLPWHARSSGTDNTLNYGIATNQAIMAVGDNGSILSSPTAGAVQVNYAGSYYSTLVRQTQNGTNFGNVTEIIDRHLYPADNNRIAARVKQKAPGCMKDRYFGIDARSKNQYTEREPE
jgi:hypothetical protein